MLAKSRKNIEKNEINIEQSDREEETYGEQKKKEPRECYWWRWNNVWIFGTQKCEHFLFVVFLIIVSIFFVHIKNGCHLTNIDVSGTTIGFWKFTLSISIHITWFRHRCSTPFIYARISATVQNLYAFCNCCFYYCCCCCCWWWCQCYGKYAVRDLILYKSIKLPFPFSISTNRMWGGNWLSFQM